MPDYLVLHRQWAHDEVEPERAEQELRQLGLLNPYLLVALVACPSLDDAFRLTNHIDAEWWDNDGIIAFRPARSTSPNDVIVEHATGICHLCQRVGWARLTGVNVQFDISHVDYNLKPRYRLPQIRLLAMVNAR